MSRKRGQENRPLVPLLGGTGLVDVAGQKLRNTVTGDHKPIDYNRDAMLPAQLTSRIRDDVEQDIVDAIGTNDSDEETSPMRNGKFLTALYQLAMDLQDSAAVKGLSAIHPAVGAVASGLLSDTAATQAMLDAKQGGATDQQALTEGILSVFYDMIFGQTKLGTLLKFGGSFLEDMTN